jgi:hypothetical protein
VFSFFPIVFSFFLPARFGMGQIEQPCELGKALSCFAGGSFFSLGVVSRFPSCIDDLQELFACPAPLSGGVLLHTPPVLALTLTSSTMLDSVWSDDVFFSPTWARMGTSAIWLR